MALSKGLPSFYTNCTVLPTHHFNTLTPENRIPLVEVQA